MIYKKRPYITMNTPLKNVPREWLVDIEPRVFRHKRFKECWIWTGAVQKDGYPYIRVQTLQGKASSRRVTRIIADMFYEGVQKYDEVVLACGNCTCVNPAHMQIVQTHWSQRTLPPKPDYAGDVKPGVDDRRKPKKKQAVDKDENA